MAYPMGEANKDALRLDFDRHLMLQFRGSTITSDAGLLAYRELDDALHLTDTAADKLADARTGKNGRHQLAGLLRQSVFGRLAGYEDVNDAEKLCRDPAMRWVVGGRAIAGSAASESQMGRFETKWLSRPENLTALADLSGQWIDKVRRRRGPKTVILDMDSSESPTYGEQEGSAYNGHFGCTCYHPLFVFNQFGDGERCALRPGNVHSAEGWREVLEPVIARYRDGVKRRYFRADAAFASPEVYACLRYQAKSWSRSRRVVAKVEWHPSELYPRIGFLVTNLRRPPERVVAFYNQRGTAEQWIREGKTAAKWTRLSCRSMRANAVRLQLHALAYNLANFLRTLALPDEVERWSLSTLRETVVKIGAKVIAHARSTVFQMAEVAVPRELFGRILEMINELRPGQMARF